MLIKAFLEQVKKSPEKVAIKTNHKALTYEELNRYSNQVAYKILEKCDPSQQLTESEIIRYKRQMLIEGWDIDGQEKLKNTTVFVAGAGGSGSPLIMQLALCGIGNIIVCDDDVVELSNLNRQCLHDESRIGMLKVESAQLSINKLNPNVNIITRSERITKDNVDELVGESAIIFDNVDHLETKFVLSKCAVQKQIPHIISSMIDLNAYVAIFHSPKTPCFHCLYDIEKLKEIEEIEKYNMNYKKIPNSVASPSLFLSTGFACNEAIKIILGLPDVAYNKYFLFNQRGNKEIVNTVGHLTITYPFSNHFRETCEQQGFSWDEGWRGNYLEELLISHNPDCPMCGSKAIENKINKATEKHTKQIKEYKAYDQVENQKVALLFEHGIDMIVGTIGALKACKTYVPFDPSYPENRLLYMIENSEAELIVTNNANYELAQKLIAKSSSALRILNIDDNCNEALDTEIEREEKADRIAYLLYTSGSTGTPKGVIQSHKNVLHFIKNYIQSFDITEKDRMTLFSAFGHDAAVMDIYSSLLSGATLYPLNIRRQMNIEELHKWLTEEQISIWHSVPTLYRFFVNALDGEEKLNSLRYIVLGGESVLEQDVAKFRKLSEHAALVNLYGQSESSYNSSQIITSVEDFAGINLGEPISDIKMYVLNKKNRVAAPLSAGEIVIASHYLALGYWKDEVKTEKAFENHPEFGRIYRTGDMGCLTEEGVIEYLGRNDFQIKIRGFRVELEEVENCLLKHEAVKAAAVIGKEDSKGNKYICGYFTSDEALSVSDLREFIAKELPDYMIPAYFTRVDKLPLTGTGKIDRAALKEVKETVASEKLYEAPRNEVEQKLAGMWQEVLGIDKIGINGSFFELGGHSLNAVSLIGKIHKTMNVEVPLKEIFKAPTIKGLSEYIEGVGESKFITIEEAEKRDYYEISSAQKRMYIMQQMEPDTISYNMPGVLVMEGELDEERLKTSMAEIVKRHEALRTSFKWEGTEVVQTVHEEVVFEVAYKDGSEEEIDAEIKDFIKPFDLSCAPLLRVKLVKVRPDKHVLMYDMHHIISDGASIAILVSEFVELYQKKTLPALRLQYKDYVTWQNKPENKGKIEQQGKYWLDLLRGEIPLLAMPLDYERKENISFAGNTVYFELENSIVEQLKKLAQKENITLNMLLLSCYNVLLSQYTGQEDIIVGSLVSNRNHSDLSHVMGAFINYLPIRSKVDKESSITAFLKSQKNIIAQAYNQQEYPFDKIVENIGYKAEIGRNPIFDTMLIYHNEFDRRVDIKIDKLSISQYEFNTPTATLDFKLDIYMDHGDVLKCYMEYKTDLYKEATILQLLKHYEMVLESVIKDSEAKLSDIQIFNQQEQNEIEKKRIGNITVLSDVNLTVAATFTGEPIEGYAKWWCEKNGIRLNIQFAPYNQVFQELLDAQSMTSKNTGINLLMLRFEDWIRDTKANEQVQKQTLENQYDKLLEAIRNRSTRALTIIGIFPVSEHFGLSEEITTCIEKLYKKMVKEISSLEGISILDFTNTAALYDIKETFDAVRDKTGHMPFSDAYYAAIGTMVARKTCATRHNPFKVIAVDCDNALWHGICGEDGALGVKIEKPYEALQKLLIRKHEEGMLVVLCSKNNEADVLEVFDKHPDMLLKKEQLAGWQINWRTKSENVKQLAEEMNLGIDSFIFIDDSPTECLDMMKNNPQVLTLQLPEEPQQIEQYLKHVWAFDKEKVTEEDKIRTKLYQVEKQRKEIQSSSFTLDEFLKELKLEVCINNMEKEQISRVSQLTQRTNQFNLSTVRRTEEEVEALFNNPNTKCWTIEVEDKFGEYGLTGVVVIENRRGGLFMDTFLLSCRVLGRGIEAAIMAELGNYCQKEGINKIEADYYPTQKNQIVADFLEKNQWKKTEESNQHTKYEIQVDNIATAIAYIECSFGKPSKQKTEEAGISHIESYNAGQAEAVAVLDEVIENNWQLNIENEEELLHINYLLPLRYCTGQMLLELPTNENKGNNIKHENYEAASNPLEEKLVKLWEEILKVDGIGINDNFYDVGGNSFTLLTLHSKIDSLYPGRIKATDLFNLTSIKKIAAYINQKESDKNIALTHAEERTVRDKIAIIGIAAKLPLGHTIEEIYEGLKNGVDCVKVMPDGRRQDIEDFVRFAGGNEQALEFLKEAECGFIGDIDKFDYSFFNISPKEASLMDPCQRIFLETAWEAIEDAGYGGNKIKGSRTGVFIGHNSLSSGMYSKLVTTVDEALYQMSIAGNVPMIIASRISYLLDLRGPAILLDTACSSSLIAVYSACNAIRSNDCDMAIAGGIKLYLPSSEGMFNGMDKLGIVSSSNRTKAFDDNSDGTGFGEGISAILLKPLEKALEDGDNIYAVIDGGAMNQDGSSIGITAPNPEAQEDLLLRAWQNAGISPENITYIEAHGTGTKLGDQIELESMNRAFRRYTEKMQFCAISSIKTNIGHLESAAGIAGLLKAVISLKYKELFPNIHFTTPRREIDFIKAPYYVNVKHQAWQKNDFPRICGVSSFGLGGTNCHLVLEEAPYREYDSEPWGEMPQILTLSAKTESSLKRLVARYKAYFDDGIEGSLSDICYTANTGRGHYKYRLAIIAGTKLALEDKINRLVSENLASDEYDGIYYSHDPLNEKISDGLDMSLYDEEQVLEKSLDELCKLYINDVEINWDALYQNSDNRRKVRLPAYQFEESRCWVSIPEGTIRRNIVNQSLELPISKQVKEIHLDGKADKNYTQTEKLIGQVLGELMGFDTLNINDDFYELGGDSLIAMDVVNGINQKLLTNVKVRDLLGTSVICEFCDMLDTTYLNKRTNEAGVEKIKKVEKRDYYPVSSAQKRVYILNMLESNSTFYNIPSVVMLPGSIDKQRFEKVFRTLIERHESLRTSFEMLEGIPIQRIHDTVAFDISYMEGDESKAEGIIKAFIQPFDLSVAPLMRIGLLKISEEKHLLLFDIHHSIADGLSMNIIMKEYTELYNGEELPIPALQYKDYAVWQSEYASSELIKNQKEFWLDTFSGELPILNMPTDYPRPAVQCFDGDIVRKSVPLEVLESLNKKAAETGTTLFMLLLAVYNVLLFKYTRQEDIIIGSPISGRRNVQLNSVIGMFANTIALRNRPTGNKTFKAFLEEVKKNALDSYDKQDFQFEDLVESLNIRRDMSRNPLFDVMLNFLYPEESTKEAEFSLYPFENRISKFDMTIHAAETKAGLELSLEYNIGLFKQETAKQILEHYVNLIKNVVAFPDRELSEIDMLDEMEKNQLLEVFNNTDTAYQKEKTIHQLFEEQVERVPNKAAVVFENKALTYKELNQKANQLANKLRRAGVTSDSIVGIIAERSLEMVVGILGILKAGGAYLPIDPEYPADRINYMLEDSGAKLLLTYSYLIEEPLKDKQILLLDNEDLYTGNMDNLNNINKSTDLIYVIYTSGTTGKPKGVMLEHKNLVNYISWFTAKAGINEADKAMLVSSAAFDLGYTALYSSILQGAELHVMAKDAYTNPEALIKYINEKGISYVKLTPSLYSTICNCESFLEGRALDSLRLVVLGGENINVTDVESTYKLYKNIQIMNHYGPTEATVGTVACMIAAKQLELEAFMKKPVIGRPISNSKIYILDKYLKPTAIGVPGELCVAGDGLARGYLNRQSLTAEKFVPNPFISEDRIYRTGDLASWLPDGSIEFMGRIDQQVKIRGYRVELGEIENQLMKHESVREAVVIAKTDQRGQYICAYIVAEKELGIVELREHLAKGLPDYMIPSYFIQLDKMPVTQNGKIDHKALPEPGNMIDTGVTYEAPRNEIEEKLVEIWSSILNLEKVGINDNFFELGGHSLRATTMVGKIHKELNVEISLREVFKKSTIKGLAQYIKSCEKNNIAFIQPVKESEYYELSPAQIRLYTMQLMDKDSTAYNISGFLETAGVVNRDKFEQIFKKLINRHEALRTSFELSENGPVQKIHNEIDFAIQYEEAKEDKDLETILQSFVRPFDLAKAPLLRVGLIKTRTKDNREEKQILAYDLHHIISDGTSLTVLAEEFTSLYEGKELPKLGIQYKDYTQWQLKKLESGEQSKYEEYWLQQYEGEPPVLNLPTDYPRPSIQSYEGDIYTFKLDEGLFSQLKAFAAKTETTLFMVLLEILSVVLSKHSGQEDIVIGTVSAGRLNEETQRMVGLFLNSIAIRCLPQKEKTAISYLQELRDKILGAYENQDYPIEALIRKLNIKKDISRNVLFDVMLILQNYERQNTQMSAEQLAMKPYHWTNKASDYDMSLYVVESGKELVINVQYCTRLFKEKTMETFGKHFYKIASEIVSKPEQQLIDILMLDKQEADQVIYAFNNKRADYEKGKTLHQLFEEQVKKTPENVAVVYEDNQLTYRELNIKANKLASYLKGYGIKENSIVGIMTEKSIEMLVGILAVLKVGSAYLPIDPAYPKERISYMLEDSQVGLLLVQEKLKDKIETDMDKIILEDEAIYTGNGENLGKTSNSSELAYIIYTSGTTGKPKGIMTEHRNVIAYVNSFNSMFELTEKDATLQQASIAFDGFVEETYSMLACGGKVVIPRDEQVKEAKELKEIIDKNGVSILSCSPLILSEFNKLKPMETVHTYLSSSDILKKEYYTNIIKKANIYNMYGPSEATVCSTCYTCTGEEETKVSIGRPITNYRLYILDEKQQPQPVGVQGEIYISGEGIARGYINKAELTKDKFLINPFVEGEKMYRTGDMARWLDDGNIEFIGRTDHQVKLRGYRIEVGEIESMLLKHEAIQEAVVMAREDEQKEKYLIAYITANKKMTVGEIREHLKEELPEYMLPQYYIQPEKMPLTPNGKIDKRVLEEYHREIETGIEYEAPKNEIEEKLVKLWQEVLRVEKVGINDNFFELGGHSLRATNVIGKINELFDVEVPLREMFMIPTIKGMAEYISSMEKKLYEEIAPTGFREYYPVSSIQKRIYIIQQFDETNISYNTPTVMIFEGQLDKARFEAAFRMLTERHEAFRTSFEFEGEQIVQIIHDINCHIQYDEADEANIPSIIKKFIQPFDLSKAPLIRTKLVKTAVDRHILMLDAHHIILDGTSIEIMVDEFMRLYEGETLAPLRIQYKDYAVWQNEIMDKAILKKQEQYWVKEFEGELPVLSLPTDFSRPEVQSSEGDIYSILLEKELSNQLNELAMNQGVTLFTLLLAIYNITISKYSGQNDIVVGTVTAGRGKEELSQLVGVFLNNIAFRCKIDVEMRFDTYLDALKGTVIDGYENQDYPIEELIEKLDLRKDMSRNTLFDVMIILQNFESRISHIKNNTFSVSLYPSNNMSSKCDMILSILEGVKGLVLNLGYCTRLFKKETIERFAYLFSNIAREIVANPRKQLKEIDILSEEKKQQLLEAFNQTKADYPYDKVFHQMFEEQVEKTPDRIALVFEKEQMTYKELNEKSNQLARQLKEKGIRNECIVGVMVDRSIEMIVSILAVLKAGGAYLPIDPEYPQDRIEYMLYDSDVQILLTQKKFAEKLQFKSETIDIKDTSIYVGHSSNLPIINKPEDLVYVIYTSGTTDKPKGVMVEHRNLINIADGWRKAYKLDENEIKLLQMASMSFDVFAGDLSRALLNGGKMIICPSDVRLDPPSLYKLMKEHQINMFESTPALVIPLMEYIYDSSQEVDWLKLLILGSDSCLIADFRKLLERFSANMRILNSYGITEATIDSSYYEASTANIEGEGNVPIGKPMQNTSFYILDDNLKPKAIGQYGELYIGGAGVARGYLNKPELTEERFISDPFMKGSRMYKTGDLVKWDSNGNVEFLGRLDNQVKIRGYRIELGEIESHLTRHEAIKDAVVVPWGEGSDKYLCAYIVAEAAEVQNTIRSYLAELMPDYMIPTYYMQIDSIPLTPNGKVDRKALPKPSGYARLGHAYEAPLTQTEKELVRIWEVLLHTEGIGVLDNFFELGGHSLKATMLVGRLYKELGFELPLKEVFKAPTIRAMGDYIDKHKDKEKIYGDESLILLRKAGNQKKTLFLIHDISCDVNGYKNFCSNMKADINCWGIKADMGKGYVPVWTEVKEIAASYVEKIKTLQSEGPYYLGGWSVGGIIAFEMASQLEQQGYQIDGIWLFDTDSPSDEGKEKSTFSLADETKFISSILPDNWLSEKAKTINTTDELWLEAIDYMERHGVSVESIIKLTPKYAKQIQAIVENLEINEIVRYVNMIRTINRAIYDYLPSTKIKATVHLIKAKDSSWLKPMNWEVYIENHYEVTEIEGDHFTIFSEPNVHELTEAFDKSMEGKA
ncbi:MAG: amino acid adenylation domain-containing protein [Lutisporaceae bacterium]